MSLIPNDFVDQQILWKRIMGLDAFAGAADDDEDNDSEQNHEDAYGDGGFEVADAQLEPDGGWENLGFAAGCPCEHEDGAELSEASSPGDASGGEDAAARSGERHFHDRLQSRASEGHGDVFGARGEVFKCAAHGAHCEGATDDELGEYNSLHGVRDAGELFDEVTESCLKQDE